jgi:hypothetical protein
MMFYAVFVLLGQATPDIHALLQPWHHNPDPKARVFVSSARTNNQCA